MHVELPFQWIAGAVDANPFDVDVARLGANARHARGDRVLLLRETEHHVAGRDSVRRADGRPNFYRRVLPPK